MSIYNGIAVIGSLRAESVSVGERDAVVAGEEKAGMAYVHTVPGRGIVDVILV